MRSRQGATRTHNKRQDQPARPSCEKRHTETKSSTLERPIDKIVSLEGAAEVVEELWNLAIYLGTLYEGTINVNIALESFFG